MQLRMRQPQQQIRCRKSLDDHANDYDRDDNDDDVHKVPKPEAKQTNRKQVS